MESNSDEVVLENEEAYEIFTEEIALGCAFITFDRGITGCKADGYVEFILDGRAGSPQIPLPGDSGVLELSVSKIASDKTVLIGNRRYNAENLELRWTTQSSEPIGMIIENATFTQ